LLDGPKSEVDSAMLALSDSVCIEAPVEATWAVLARLTDIERWSEAVVAARCEGPLSSGVGAERTCDLKGGLTILERWTAWDEGRSFTYQGLGLPLVAHAENTWTVEAEGARTLLRTEARLSMKGGLIGRQLLEPLVAAQSKRLSRHSLASIKYFVEHGVPAPEPHKVLPLAAANC
jgi:ligand-binding SRPBCC domain-containing protein